MQQEGRLEGLDVLDSLFWSDESDLRAVCFASREQLDEVRMADQMLNAGWLVMSGKKLHSCHQILKFRGGC